VKQNVGKLISLWKQVNEKRNLTGFGDVVKDDGTTVTTQDQLLAIYDVFFELVFYIGVMKDCTVLNHSNN
jgi:hypothetical protein